MVVSAPCSESLRGFVAAASAERDPHSAAVCAYYLKKRPTVSTNKRPHCPSSAPKSSIVLIIVDYANCWFSSTSVDFSLHKISPLICE